MFGRRTLVVALAVGVWGGYELVPRDERRILSVVNELCATLNQTRDAATLASLQRALRAWLLQDVSVELLELGQSWSGLDTTCDRSQELLAGPPLSFSLADAEVQVTGARARVNADLIVTVRGSGEQHRDLRRTEVWLRKSGQAWRIESVRVEPVQPAEPEARP